MRIQFTTLNLIALTTLFGLAISRYQVGQKIKDLQSENGALVEENSFFKRLRVNSAGELVEPTIFTPPTDLDGDYSGGFQKVGTWSWEFKEAESSGFEKTHRLFRIDPKQKLMFDERATQELKYSSAPQ